MRHRLRPRSYLAFVCSLVFIIVCVYMYVIIESAGLTGGAGSSPVDQVLLPFHSLLNSHVIITTRRELWKVLFLAPSVCGFLFVYEISRGTTEWIRAKFTWKTCLAPRSEEFEGQRSRSPWTKNGIVGHFGGLCVVYVW